MSGLSEAILPSRGLEPGPVTSIPDAGQAAARRPATAVLAAWILIGLGISAHDGEWSAWGLAALLAAFVVLLGVAVSGRQVGPVDRRALGAALAASLAAAAVHPAYRLMHVRGAGIVAVD